MCEAFRLTRGLLNEWLQGHNHSFPPVVLHLTDGESTDDDPSNIAQEILSLGTSDGQVLLCNCHVSSRHAMKIEYPSDESRLPDDFARTLFRISSPLPGYAEEKARGGAFAAFVGLAFLRSSEGLAWQMVALGDSCLIHKRKDGTIEAMPLSDPAAFGFHPILLPSKAVKQQGIIDSFIITTGRVEPGDVFFLFSDAIAAWYLQETMAVDSSRATHFERLIAVDDSVGVQKVIACERHKQTLRNDDVAIVRVAVCDPTTKMGSVVRE